MYSLMFCLHFCQQLLFSEQDLICLAKNIYFEARSEPLEGQFYVGYVTINRYIDGRWPRNSMLPKTLCGVVEDDWQFSWFWDGKSDKPKNITAYNKAISIAKAILGSERYIDITKNALYYHSIHVTPKDWNLDSMILLTKKGNHIFYTDK